MFFRRVDKHDGLAGLRFSDDGDVSLKTSVDLVRDICC